MSTSNKNELCNRQWPSHIYTVNGQQYFYNFEKLSNICIVQINVFISTYSYHTLFGLRPFVYSAVGQAHTDVYYVKMNQALLKLP